MSFLCDGSFAELASSCTSTMGVAVGQTVESSEVLMDAGLACDADYTSTPSAAASSSNTPTLYITLTRGSLRYVFEAHVYSH